MQHALTPAVAWTQRVAVASLLGLILLGVLWELWLAPTGSGMLALKVLPLTLALPGVLRRRLYTYRWVSLFVWLYAAEGLVRMGAEPGIGRWLAVGEAGLSVLIFVGCSMQVRQRLRAAKTA